MATETHHSETVDPDAAKKEASTATLLLDAPIQRLSVAVQRTMDIVGHTLRAVEEFHPDRDLALQEGVIAAFGTHVESHIPGMPIALQVAPSIPLEGRGAAATAWVLRKGLSDLITSLSAGQVSLFV